LCPLKGCLNNVNIQGFSAVKDKASATPTVVWTLWVNPITGALGSALAGMTIGECVPCKTTEHLEFAWYKQAGVTTLQSKVLGFYQGINADFLQSVVGDYEVLFTIDGVQQAGNAAGTIWPGNYPVPSTGVQSFADYLNNHPANTAPKDIWSAAGTIGNEALVIVATAGGIAPNHVWNGVAFAHYTVGVHDYMTIKGSPDSADVEIATASTCTKIEVIKERNSCTKEMELYGYDSKGKLIAGFDVNNIFLGTAKELMRDICVSMKAIAPATEGVRWDLKEVVTTSPCGDVTIKYFDPDVSPMVEVAESLIQCINGEGKCPCCEDAPVNLRSHVFKNASIPASNSIWTVPATAASPVSRFQVTARDVKGSTLDIKVNGLTTTTFSIDATVASSNIQIFVEPMDTIS
jgi:hypothetical protein